MARYRGDITKRAIDRILTVYAGPPLQELGFRRRGAGAKWSRESIPGLREHVQTTSSQHGPVEGLGNDFDITYEASRTGSDARPHGNFLTRLTSKERRQFLEIDRGIAMRLDEDLEYPHLSTPYADLPPDTWWSFRCLDEDDVHLWGRFIQPLIQKNYTQWFKENVR